MPSIFPFLLPLFIASAMADVFYADPAAGNMANTGSRNSPWRTLAEVIGQNKIASRTASGAARNPGAPVKAGDTVMLRSGYHGTLVLNDYSNPGYITLMAEPGQVPRLGSVRMTGAGRWILKGLTISPSFLPAYSRQGMVAVQGGSKDVILDSLTVYSVPDASGWSSADWNNLACNGLEAWQSTFITARRCHFKNVNFGMETGDHGLLEHNTIENFAGDGMRCNGDSTVIQYNLIKNLYFVNANHPDGIQAWTTGPGGVGTGVIRGNVIRGNTILNHDNPAQRFKGSLQAIGLFDGTYRDWIVENNVIINDSPHGIAFYGAVNCRVVNNTVVDVNPGGTPPWIRITAHKNGTPSTGCLIRNNLTTGISSDANVAKDHNIIVTNYAAHFVNYSGFDLRLVSASSAIGAGSALLAPALDRNGMPRPQGGSVDAGAYEFGTAATADRSGGKAKADRNTGRIRLAFRGQGIRFQSPGSMDMAVLDAQGRRIGRRVFPLPPALEK